MLLIYKSFAQGGSFTNLLLDRLQLHPCSPERPWRLIVYCDEVVPGNALSHDNKRKFWILYFSFLELGPVTLQMEEAWFCCLARRSREVSKLAAGISQVVAVVLRHFFGELGCNLRTGGMVLRSPTGCQRRLFCGLGMVVQDGGAHKLLWHCKGDAGTRPLLQTLIRNLDSEINPEPLNLSRKHSPNLDP